MNRRTIPLILFTLALFFSILLTFTDNQQICSIDSSCSIVNNSPYSKTLGFNNSTLGIITFTTLIALTILNWKIRNDKTRLALILTSLAAALGALYFIFVQKFILNTFCPYCLTVDISAIAAFTYLVIKKPMILHNLILTKNRKGSKYEFKYHYIELPRD